VHALLVMTLLVRDEEDILEANLDFHLTAGVDFVLATDHRSVDRTPAILARYERQGVLRWKRVDEEGYEQGRWVTRMARLAHEMGADWVINSDADEFWWPRQGTLASTLAGVPGSIDTVVVRRTDFPPVSHEAGPFWERMIYRELSSFNLIGRPILPKVCHRARPAVTVAQGNHSVSGEGLGETLEDGRIEILHFPLRSYRQFETKIRNGGAAYAVPGAPPGVGLAWRHAHELWLKGELRNLFEQRVLDSEVRQSRLKDGSIVTDTRLRDAMRRLVARVP
jgi:hypothetical protein